MTVFILKFNKLKTIQQNIEKGDKVFYERFAKFEEGKNIVELKQNLDRARVNEIEKLHSDLKNISIPLNTVKNSVNKANIKNIDLETLKTELVAIQDNIRVTKQGTKSQLETLEQEETELDVEVECFKQQLGEWDKKVVPLSVNKSGKAVQFCKNDNVCQEAKEFQAYVIAHGGHENGWNIEDHNIFLRQRNKCKDRTKLAHRVHALLPDISQESVVAHENWYQKYLELKSGQRIAIKKWRLGKSHLNTGSRKLQAQDDRKTPTESARIPDLDKRELQQKISSWKVQKMQLRRQQNEFRIHEASIRREKEFEKRRKDEKIRKQVAEWRQIRIEQEQLRKEREKRTELEKKGQRAAEANVLIKLYQSQDDIFLQRRHATRTTRARSLEPAVHTNFAARDPDRLYKPTKNWIHRTIKSEQSASDPRNSYIKLVPKLGIPAWRRSIT